MGFIDVRFPTQIGYGSRGGAGFNTSLVALTSGAEEAIARWQIPRHSYDAQFGVRDWATLLQLKTFHIQVYGSANPFRFLDPLDFTTDPSNPSVRNATRHATEDLWIGAYDFDDVVIGTGDASNKVFQMKKFYQYGSATPRTRNLTKIISDGTTDYIKVGINGVEQASGWSVDLLTGIITFTTAPGNGLPVTAGCMFDVPVRFGIEADELLAVSMNDFNSGGMSTPVPLIETFEDVIVAEEYPYGGSSVQTVTEDITISPYMGRFILLDVQAGSLNAFLPDPTPYEEGAVHYIIQNPTGGTSITLDDGILTGTLAAGETAECAVVNDAGSKEWRTWK